MWFATGIVMIFAGGMPRLTPDERLHRLPDLDLTRMHLTASQAVDRAGSSGRPSRAVLLSIADRPAYRLAGARATTVFADTGEVMGILSADRAREIAGRFMNVPGNRLRHVRTLTTVDQWTIDQSSRLPLQKFSIGDPDGTELYVSSQTGEVTTVTTRRARAVAWIGTIPHWLYFAALRTRRQLWYDVVVWISSLGCILATLGLTLGAIRFRRSALPYSGWTAWHYVTGLTFGVFTLAWSFSGLLSMEPFAWTIVKGVELERNVFTGGLPDLSRFTAPNPALWKPIVDRAPIKEIELVRIQGDHYFVVRSDGGTRLVAADTLEPRLAPFSTESLIARLGQGLPGVPIAESQLLTGYDAYYYSKDRLKPLPVLRVKLGDPARTWFYIDPVMSQVVGEVHRSSRLERWVYNGLHSLDFPFWYGSRVREGVMILLCLGGFTSSGIGLMLGIRRLRRRIGPTRAHRLQ